MSNKKINALNKVSFVDIEKVSNEIVNPTYIKLTKLFKDSTMREDDILNLVRIIFVIEALILTDLMRDERLNDLDKDEVESLALELYLTLEKERSIGGGYMQLCDASNNILDEHLSRVEKYNFSLKGSNNGKF